MTAYHCALYHERCILNEHKITSPSKLPFLVDLLCCPYV